MTEEKKNTAVNSLDQLRLASTTAKSIIDGFIGKQSNAPDVVAARTEELKAMKKEDIIALVIELEKPKVDRPFKTEDVVKALLESPECACFNYEQIAALVQQAMPGAKTSSKSVASYASKKKDVWNVVKREKIVLDPAAVLAMQGTGTEG